jgi:glyoxylase-like metal-dependent hydrolase (beta-lactamase superfamily II)
VEPAPRVAVVAADTAWVSDVLYFGRSIPGGGRVTDADWEAFLGQVVTPLFPDGLTVWEAHGQWRSADGRLAREDSRVVQVVHRPSPAADSAVARVGAEYRRRFGQESVLRVRSRVEVAF